MLVPIRDSASSARHARNCSSDQPPPTTMLPIPPSPGNILPISSSPSDTPRGRSPKLSSLATLSTPAVPKLSSLATRWSRMPATPDCVGEGV